MMKTFLINLSVILMCVFITTAIVVSADMYLINTDSGDIRNLSGQGDLHEKDLGASVLFPYQGGTGTSTVPGAGYVLIGNGTTGL